MTSTEMTFRVCASEAEESPAAMTAAGILALPLRSLMLALIASLAVAYSSSGLPPALLFKDAVNSIARKEGWDPDMVRVSKFAGGSVRLARSRRLEFQVRSGSGTLLVFTLPEELDGGAWRKPRRRGRERAWWRLHKHVRWPRPRLNRFALAGPLELKAIGDDRLSILLPVNSTRAGLKRILIGGGIRIEVDGAEEITLSHPSATGAPLFHHMESSWLGSPPLCLPLLSISISGSASIAAYKTHSDKAPIETSSRSPEALELLSDKCYSGSRRQDLPPSIISLMKLPEGFLNLLLGGGRTPRAVEARMMAFTLVRFKVEVEREIGKDDRKWSRAPAWKSRPAVEREWFEVLSRAGAGAGAVLKPVFQRRLRRAAVVWDSVLMGTLLPNVSFSRLHSFVRPPEAFTLDIEW